MSTTTETIDLMDLEISHGSHGAEYRGQACLVETANLIAAGRAETYVPKRGTSPLAKHARERRKAKRKAQKLARRRNR